MKHKKEIEETNTSLTPEESAIFQRVSHETDDWKTITEEEMEDFSLMEDPYKLPAPAMKQQNDKQFAFRWAEASSKRIDVLRSLDPPAKWWVCNRAQTPFLEGHFDPSHGGVQRLDQILLFKPMWMHVRHQEAKQEITRIQDTAGDIKNRDGYKEDWGEWRSGESNKITGSDEVMADFNDVIIED